jgi:hypothetical protein
VATKRRAQAARRGGAPAPRKQTQPWKGRPSNSALVLYRLVPTRLKWRAYISPVRRIESSIFARSTGGSRLFGNAFLVLIGFRALRDATKRKPEVLTVDKLAPGQSIAVRTAPVPGKGLSPKQRQQGLPA